jgi:uncharacterized LabA/DUF88 family protein
VLKALALEANAFSFYGGKELKKIMVFIDGNNFENAVNSLYGCQTKIDYHELAKNICDREKGDLQRLYYYTAKSSKEKEKAQSTERFANFLNKKVSKCIAKVGFLKFKGVDENGKDIYEEKGTDVNIAVDMVSLAFQNAYDEAVLLSADSDYEPAIRTVRNYGKNVTVGLVDKQTGGFIKDICDHNIILDKEFLNNVKR